MYLVLVDFIFLFIFLLFLISLYLFLDDLVYLSFQRKRELLNVLADLLKSVKKANQARYSEGMLLKTWIHSGCTRSWEGDCVADG